MDNRLIKIVVLAIFIAISQLASAQDLTFTVVSGDTDCDSPAHCVDIEVTGFSDLATFQFIAFYDTIALDYVSNTSLLPPILEISEPSNGEIRIGWTNFSGSTYTDNTTVIELCFEPTGQAGSTTIDLGQDVANGFSALAATIGFTRIYDLGTDYFLNDGTFNITDDQNPTISCPLDTLVTGTGSTAINDLAPMFADNCLVDMVTYSLAGVTSGFGNDDVSGTSFNEGITNVTYEVTDGGSNTASCSFDVEIDVPFPADTTFTFVPEISLDCENGTVEMCMTVLNANMINSIGVYWTWDETQFEYVSSNVVIPGSGIVADNFANIGRAGFIWSYSPPPSNPLGGFDMADGDTLFCLQHQILAPLDTALFNIMDLAGLPIEVTTRMNGMETVVPHVIADEIYNVNDNTPPVFTNCPMDVTINAPSGSCEASHTWTSPTAMDECIANLPTDSTHASGDLFPVGVTTVTYSMTDLGGNVGTCSFTITVNDSDSPTATCRMDTTVVGPGPIAVNGLAINSATDACGAVTTTWTQSGATTGMGTDDVSGSNFENGMTTVTYFVTDGSGNIDSCLFIVTVDPPALPEIDCPNDTIVGSLATDCSAMVSDLSPTIVSSMANIDSVHFNLFGATSGSGLSDVSGTTFNLGVTTVRYYLTDLTGAIDSCEFLVEVQDTTAPVVTCPPLDQFSNEPRQCGVIVSNNLFPTSSDNCSVASTTYVFTGATGGAGSNDPTGSFFNVGTTNIEYTVTDGSGNISTCTVVVIVNDEETPTISCPMDTIFMIPFGSTEGTLNDIDPIASDNCPSPGTSYNVTGATMLSGTGSASGQSFNLGINNVTYYVSDSGGNLDSCEFIVTVQNLVLGDLIECPDDTIVSNDTLMCGAIVNDLAPTILVDPAFIDSLVYIIDGATMGSDSGDVSGTFFNTNISTIKYYVTDIFGNVDSCQFTVTVNDTEMPAWTGCPDTIPVYVNDMSCRQLATWSDPIPSDNCGIQNLMVSHMQGDTFDLGFTTVTYTAEDAAMNIGTCDFVIWVRDTFPPTFTCPNDTIVTTTTGCSMAVSWPDINEADNCTIATVSSTQNSGDDFPVGVTTIVYTVTDDSGNSTQCSFNITVLDGAAPVFICPAEIVVRVDGTIVSDPANLITSTTPSATCDDIVINFNNPEAADACDGITAATQIGGSVSGSTFVEGAELLEFVSADMNGNSDTCRFDLTVLPLADVIIEMGGANPPCEGSDVELNILNPTTGATYTWTGPNGFTSSGVTVTIFNIDANDIGLYSVECNAGGSCNALGTIQVDLAPVPNISAGSNSPLCASGTSELILNGIDDGSSVTITAWNWTGPNAFISSDQNPIISAAGSSESGTYEVTATGANGCTATATVEVTIDDAQAPNINSDCNGVICLGESCTLLGSEFSPIPDSYVWTVSPSATAGLPSNTNQSSIELTPTAEGIYVVTYQVVLAGGCETQEATFVLTVEGTPEAVDDAFTTSQNVSISQLSLADNDIVNTDLGSSIDIVDNPSNGIVALNSDGLFTYVPAEGFIGSDAFSYELCSNCDSDLCSRAVVFIEVEFPGDDCEIPTVISPNNDGKNDFLVVDCILSGDFPSNKIAIYNQWGDKVFEAAPYNNDWGGTFEGNPLPDGTYFFIFDDGKGGDISKGAITIFR